MTELNLCKEISDAMVKIGFSEKAVEDYKTSSQYVTAYDSSAPIQRTMLIMYFYNKLMSAGEMVPRNIRIGLNAATDSLVWYEDLVGIVLPFLHANQDRFYP